MKSFGDRLRRRFTRFLGRVGRVLVGLAGRDPQRAGEVRVWTATQGVVVHVDAEGGCRVRLTITIGDGAVRDFDVGPADAFEIRIPVLDGGGPLDCELRLDGAAADATIRLVPLWFVDRIRWALPRAPEDGHDAFAVVRRVTLDPVGGRVVTTGSSERPRPSLVEFYRGVVALAAEEEARATPLPGLDRPLISLVVPVWNAAPTHLDDLLRSFARQREGLAEIILCDDASTSTATRTRLVAAADLPGVRVVTNAVNAGIAVTSNAGIAVARGTWVGFVDHDDALAPFALDRIARALSADPEIAFLHTDEMITGASLELRAVYLKPAWDEVLLSGVNYVNHLSLYRRDRLVEIGGFRTGFEGSQDYDLVLRYTAGLSTTRIRHLPYPAYLWRRTDDTFSVRHLDAATAAARTALAEHFGVSRVEGAIEPDLHRLRFDAEIVDWPRVSVVIPNRNAPALMRTVLRGLADRTDYPDLEVVIVDNGSDDPEIPAVYEEFRRAFRRTNIQIEKEEFNFSRSINKGVARASGELLLLLNNDIEVIEPGWLKEMVSCLNYRRVGVVGAMLLYPDRRIQHAGVIAGLGGLAGHWFGFESERHPGPMGRLWVRQTMSCVTAACMLVSRDCWDAVGPLNEVDFAIAYNDVDFGLRASGAGFRVVWTPFARLLHHESATRGSDETAANIDRFRREQDNLRRLHATDVFEDRAFNPWYSRGYSVPFPVLRETLPAARD